MAQNMAVLYALSTCSHCKSAKEFLTKHNVECNNIEVDLFKGEERKAILADIRELNPRCSFPTMKINDIVIVGFKKDKIREVLEIQD